MQYGHFDDAAREYVITRPDTPKSWSNYLGDRTYGGIITNQAGGYGFSQSPAEGRILRLRFNSVPMDQPGRNFYLRDVESGDYWSAAWQPVGKSLDEYESVCRHGTAYTVISSRYAGIETESTYFIPLGQAFEYWRLKVKNTSDRPRRLSVFTYAEFASEWNMTQDQLNLQYTSYTVRGKRMGDLAEIATCGNLPGDPDNFANRDQGRWSWMSLVGSPIVGHELSREAFIGPYRSYHNPLTVEQGQCGNSEAYGDNACGCFQSDIELAPGEEKTLLVLLGVGKVSEAGQECVIKYGNIAACEAALAELKSHWHSKLGAVQVKTPEPAFDSMVNVWNAYNALMTFTWSRSCSLVYTGDMRDGFGYRDTVQDIVGILPAIPQDARERMILMLSGQESTGGARPEIRPWAHQPGKMPLTPPEGYRSDDCLWFFNSIPAYVAETGDVDFYREVVPYSDSGEATVFGHLRRAIEFNLEHSGAHGLPCGLMADWNDCLKLGFRGESVFVTFQLRLGLATYIEIAHLLNEPEEATWAKTELEKLDANIQKHTWDGDWFVRAFGEDGSVFGARSCEEGRIFLNAQSWAVLSGAATEEQARQAMDSVEAELETPYGLQICEPAFVKESVKVVRAVLMNAGQKENGGIFSHTQGWAIMADCILGQGDRAWKHLASYLPSMQNDRIDVRKIEPYVHCQSTDGRGSATPGYSHVPWLSGTVAWTYFTMTQYILGLRPALDGFTVDPCLPKGWAGFTASRRFRGMTLDITVENPDGVSKGLRSLTVDGEAVSGDTIPLAKLHDGAKIVAVMG